MKDAIRDNFDESPNAYDEYERRTGRFEALADRLYDELDRRTSRIGALLDAGAGSGVSTAVFDERGAAPIAFDLSGRMLRECPGTIAPRVQGDFDELPFVGEAFDAVVFTASLFLTPDPARAAREARRVLRPGGGVGAVAPLGWTTLDGDDVFAPLARDSRSPTGADDVADALDANFGVESGEWAFRTTAEDLRAFHAVPAMAARLYPRLDPDERLGRARELLSDVEGPLEQRWRWFVGV
ncbi:class I SAM-dependent methyltransferase [Natronomonas sp. LN261]|uniref:class I SAM-dependent methyltransferase n=1 Tax=Natronomonas sp. LN261 TaxID=2750669 RepID=UPI0015EF173E|nr:class I SAM-dependent methyltransferase [Natronomonas sp. LN261]